MKLSLLLLLLVGCGAPDTLEIGYGHTWHSPGTAYNEQQIVGLDQGDSDTGWVAFGWDIGPRKKREERAASGLEELRDVILAMRHSTATESEPEPEPEPELEEVADVAVEVLREFDALGLTTQILLLIAVIWLSWIYRRKIGGLIGRGDKKAAE